MKNCYKEAVYFQKRDLEYLKELGYQDREIIKIVEDCNLNLNDFVKVTSQNLIEMKKSEIMDYDMLVKMNLLEVTNWFEQLLQAKMEMVRKRHLLESYRYIIAWKVKKANVKLPVIASGNFYFSDVNYGLFLMGTNLNDCFMIRFTDDHLELTNEEQQYLVEVLNRQIYEREGFVFDSDSLIITRDLGDGFGLLQCKSKKKNIYSKKLDHKKNIY